MDSAKTSGYVEENFDKDFLQPLIEFIKIPNLSPFFDQEFFSNGLIENAADHVIEYAKAMNIEGLEHTFYKEENKAPMLIFTYKGVGSKNVMLYGHLDKQPHMEGWMEGTGPTTPAIIGDRLYGRGASDDGYVPFAVLLALKTVIEQGAKLPQITIVLECEEESGSTDLVYLLDKNAEIIGKPDVCICMDSGALTYENVWLTSTLRGLLGFKMEVEVATQGTHSGLAGGIIPDTWRIANNLLARLENPETGEVIPEIGTEIPDRYREEAKFVGDLKKEGLYGDFNMLEGVKPIHDGKFDEMYLNTNWRPSLTVIGVDGIPECSKAGNVLRKSTTLAISIRLPPGVDSESLKPVIEEKLTQNVPYNARVNLSDWQHGNGWAAKELEPWLQTSLDNASEAFYGNGFKCRSYGIGGSIPFLFTLGQKFPDTQILAIGVLGMDSNAHNPNENLHVPYVRNLIKALSHILSDCGEQ